MPSELLDGPADVGSRVQPPGRAWPWPLPALATWALAWAVCAGSLALGGAPAVAAATGAAAGVGVSWRMAAPWRRAIAAGGFPLSALLVGAAAGLPAWTWLLPALPLLLLYPPRAWRDAPIFPTPAGALAGLDTLIRPSPARVLDAGAGLGHGLVALHRLWPGAALRGLEWSRPLALVAAARCRWAVVERADMWAADWSGHDLVYVFQRPENMARIHAKARAEMRPGAWLVSLEFEVPGVAPIACLRRPGVRDVWIYRLGAPRAGDPPRRPPKQRSIGAGAGR